jgi:hypothetical protein
MIMGSYSLLITSIRAQFRLHQISEPAVFQGVEFLPELRQSITRSPTLPPSQ